MSDYFDLPPGPELAARNRHVMAERVGWPEGAVEQCEMVEAYHPDWFPMWSAGGTAWAPEPGFYARRYRPHRDDRPLYGATCAELATAIDEWKQAEEAKPEWPLPSWSCAILISHAMGENLRAWQRTLNRWLEA